MGNWGLGIGEWGVADGGTGAGAWGVEIDENAQAPIPQPQNHNPQSPYI